MNFPECLTQTKWIAVMADNQDGETTVKTMRWLAASALRSGLNTVEVKAGFVPGECMESEQLKPGGAAWIFVWAGDNQVDPEIFIKNIQGKMADPAVTEYVTHYPEPANCLKITTVRGSHQSESHLPMSLVVDMQVQLKLANQEYLWYTKPSGQFGMMAMVATARCGWVDTVYNQEQYQEFIQDVDNYIPENI